MCVSVVTVNVITCNPVQRLHVYLLILTYKIFIKFWFNLLLLVGQILVKNSLLYYKFQFTLGCVLNLNFPDKST